MVVPFDSCCVLVLLKISSGIRERHKRPFAFVNRLGPSFVKSTDSERSDFHAQAASGFTGQQLCYCSLILAVCSSQPHQVARLDYPRFFCKMSRRSAGDHPNLQHVVISRIRRVHRWSLSHVSHVSHVWVPIGRPGGHCLAHEDLRYTMFTFGHLTMVTYGELG